MRKFWIGLIAAVVVIVLLLGFALFAEFSAPAAVRRIVQSAAADAGFDLEVEQFRISPARGIRLRGVVATTDIPTGSVHTTVDSVVLEHRLWPLLFGDIIVDRLLIESPVIEVVTGAPPAQPAAARRPGFGAKIVSIAWNQDDTTAAGRRPVTVHAISIVDGLLLVRSTDESDPGTQVNGLNVALENVLIDPRAPSVALGLSARGELSVGEVTFAGRTVRGDTAVLSAESGVFEVSGLVLTTTDGSLSLDEFVVDLTQDPYTYRTSLEGADLDLNAILNIAGERALGTARLAFSGGGTGSRTADFTGVGQVHLEAGKIPEIPALEQIDAFLATPIAGLAYEATRIDFEVADDRLRIAPFQIVSDVLRISAEGSVDIEGNLRMHGVMTMPPDNAPSFSSNPIFEQFAAALADDEGWMSIPLLIGGTVEEPDIGPDYDALLAALRGNAGAGLGSILQGLLRNNRKRESDR